MDPCTIYLNLASSSFLEENTEIMDFLQFHENHEEDLHYRTPKKIKLCENSKHIDSTTIAQLCDNKENYSPNFHFKTPQKNTIDTPIPVEIIEIALPFKNPTPPKSQLALRNLKLNLGTGLTQFVAFKKDLALLSKEYYKFHFFDGLCLFLTQSLKRIRSQ